MATEKKPQIAAREFARRLYKLVHDPAHIEVESLWPSPVFMKHVRLRKTQIAAQREAQGLSPATKEELKHLNSIEKRYYQYEGLPDELKQNVMKLDEELFNQLEGLRSVNGPLGQAQIAMLPEESRQTLLQQTEEYVQRRILPLLKKRQRLLGRAARQRIAGVIEGQPLRQDESMREKIEIFRHLAVSALGLLRLANDMRRPVTADALTRLNALQKEYSPHFPSTTLIVGESDRICPPCELGPIVDSGILKTYHNILVLHHFAHFTLSADPERFADIIAGILNT